MKEEYRISRNVRLAWFLGKLNRVIWPVPKSELFDGPIPCPGFGSDMIMEEVPVRNHGVSMVTADVGLVSMV
ncbi:unnamed protein product [Oncorhynchus mykiss]|uniref:Uncharacterized protein n=1 Tax=Oncorhynchus mykiss TaxID=8022 RepID=A0A060Y5K1_ONCMY|nr:unnamed protein product [Oncorhynchus mykiss]